MNHFARKCLTSGDRKRKRQEEEVKTESEPFVKQPRDEAPVNLIGNQNKFTYYDVLCIDIPGGGNEIWCNVGGVHIKVVIDSGSKYNLVDRNTWMELKTKSIETISRTNQTDKQFKAYGGKELQVLGSFAAKIQVNQKQITATFYVVNENGKFLLGRDTATLLKVLKIGYDIIK